GRGLAEPPGSAQRRGAPRIDRRRLRPLRGPVDGRPVFGNRRVLRGDGDHRRLIAPGRLLPPQRRDHLFHGDAVAFRNRPLHRGAPRVRETRAVRGRRLPAVRGFGIVGSYNPFAERNRNWLVLSDRTGYARLRTERSNAWANEPFWFVMSADAPRSNRSPSRSAVRTGP